MDGSFACPECGSTVEVKGLAHGRQVRCGFCQRLLEVPYLPRVPVTSWKRRRFASAWWMPWAWGVIGVAVAAVLLVGSLQFLKRQYRLVQEGSIVKLIESSRSHEASGRLSEALVELDAALHLARQGGSAHATRLADQQKRRGDLARRDVQSVLDRLIRPDATPFPLGEWLGLIARADRDSDLATLKPRIDERFRARVRLEADTDLASARKSFAAGSVVESLQACERIAKLLAYLPPDLEPTIRRDTEELVGRLLGTHGVVVEVPHGEFVFGSQQLYLSSMLPIPVKALESKGYLPYRPSSPWAKLWAKALYHLELSVTERLEGSYLTTENRLTRIEVRLTISSQTGFHWQTKPTARTSVPLPGLPAYLSSRLAANRERSEEIERRFYENARSQIAEKLVQALGNMPRCP
jgi:hypothetical protein